MGNGATFSTGHGNSITNVGIIRDCVGCITYNLVGLMGTLRPRVVYVNNKVYGRNRALVGPLHEFIRTRECSVRDGVRAGVMETRLNGSTNIVNTTLLNEAGWQ